MSTGLPRERQGYPAPPDLAQRRAQLAAAVTAGAWRTAGSRSNTTLAGCRVLRFGPSGAVKGRVLHLHGGGFRQGAPECEGPFAEALAAGCHVEVVVPQYRLAPEYPFPAGLSDALKCLEALREEAGDGPLVVSGASAGAGLAAGLGILAATGAAAGIQGLVLLSPWLDLTVSAPSYSTNGATDPLFSTEAAQIAADLYLQGLDAHHPLISPLHATITAYPPTLISVGAGEVLLDDSRRFHEKLQGLGSHSVLSVIEGMDHIAAVRGFGLPGAAETFSRVTDFVQALVSC
jgi:monoterpene epsilon-lactone hydrolase